MQDELGVVYAKFAYGENGRATSTELVGGVERYSVQYTVPPSVDVYEVYDSAENVVYRYHVSVPPQGVVLQTPRGPEGVAMSSVVVAGKNYLSGQAQPAGSGCAASTSAQVFDQQGDLASRDDFNQIRTCYVHDSTRHLETGRVEGLSNTTVCDTVTGAGAALPAGSRKVSTVWHPHWRLPVRRADPGKLTEWVYNGQTDPRDNSIVACAPTNAKLLDNKPIAVLCRKIERATQDADGHLGFSAPLQPGVADRETRWTYNESGQVLTEDGPRTDVADVTTYEYYLDPTDDYARGDLKQVTDELGNWTRYLRYNRFGQVLESVDANGRTTVLTYDERQRLLTSTVGGRQTTYQYDAVGQLTKLIRPDGSWLGFDYDDAHRLKVRHDLPGNRLEYQLDPLGNRTAETLKDAAGHAKRSLSRDPDALGRIQRSTSGQ